MGVGNDEPSENTGETVMTVIVVMVMIVIFILVTGFGHRSSLGADSRLCTLRTVRNRLVLWQSRSAMKTVSHNAGLVSTGAEPRNGANGSGF